MIIRKLSDYKESKVLFSNTGVSYYILKNIPFDRENSTMYVISGGAMGIPLLLYKDPEELLLRIQKVVKKISLLTLTSNPYSNMSFFTRKALEEILPEDAHIILGDRIHIGMTHFPTFKKHSVQGPFNTKADLIEALQVSSFIPIFFMRGYYKNYKNYIDGAFSHNVPSDDMSQTVSVNPSSNEGIADVYYNLNKTRHLKLMNYDQYMAVFWLGVEMANRNHNKIVNKLKMSGMYRGN